MSRLKYKQIPPKYGASMFYLGIILLALGICLSLYSVTRIIVSPPIMLTTFPFLEVSWSPIPLLLVLGAILMAGGWISWRHSVGPIMVIAVGLFGAGVISEALNFFYAITFQVGGATVYILPYGTRALELILSGMEVGVFSIIFFWVDYRVQSQRNLKI